MGLGQSKANLHSRKRGGLAETGLRGQEHLLLSHEDQSLDPCTQTRLPTTPVIPDPRALVPSSVLQIDLHPRAQEYTQESKSVLSGLHTFSQELARIFPSSMLLGVLITPVPSVEGRCEELAEDVHGSHSILAIQLDITRPRGLAFYGLCLCLGEGQRGADSRSLYLDQNPRSMKAFMCV